MKVIAFHTQHDAGLAVAVDGRLLLALELERLFEERYFASADDIEQFRAQWTEAIAVAAEFTGIEQFDVAVTSWVMRSKRRVLQELVRASEWRTVDHHVAHALNGLHDSPFARPLVVSYDGGGNDGTFRVFRGVRSSGSLTPVARPALNLGTPYRLLATTMPEVTGGVPQPRAGHLALAGKVMAYAGLGEVRPAWLAPVVDYYRTYQEPNQALYSLGEATDLDLERDRLEAADARALAATSQRAFSDLVLEVVQQHLGSDDDGLVVTGGCALNVITNERLRQTVAVPIHVPPAPNDAGIAVGALWSVTAPTHALDPFVGLPLRWDVGVAELARLGGRQVGVEAVAALVAAGAIIGIADGRAELGPRALGNRSIVAAPGLAGVRDRINARIKSRAWYQPVAPAVREEAIATFFDFSQRSPYMSFAPQVLPYARAAIPAAVHVDGSARVQSVPDKSPSLLGSLLRALQALGAPPCVLNTSFNVRGRPLLQRASAALATLAATDLDFVWIGGWLVPKHREVFQATPHDTGGPQ